MRPPPLSASAAPSAPLPHSHTPNLPICRILDSKTVPGYPFPVSTTVYPEWAVSALPHVDPDLAMAVAQALFRINQTSPEAVAGTYAHFEVPFSYASSRALWEEIGLLSSNKCIRATDMYSSITCPAGTYKRSAAALAFTCGQLALPCPPGAQCVCQPCEAVPATQTDLFVVPGDAVRRPFGAIVGARPCEFRRVCLQVPQGSTMTVVLRDNFFSARDCARNRSTPYTGASQCSGARSGHCSARVRATGVASLPRLQSDLVA